MAVARRWWVCARKRRWVCARNKSAHMSACASRKRLAGRPAQRSSYRRPSGGLFPRHRNADRRLVEALWPDLAMSRSFLLLTGEPVIVRCWHLADIPRQPQISAVGRKRTGGAGPPIALLPRLFLLFAMCDTVPEKVSRREGTHDDFTSTTCCPLRHSRLG